MNTPLGLEFSPIKNDGFKGLEDVDKETALLMEGYRRLRDMQSAPMDAVANAFSKLYPDGLPWETWRRSTNIEDFRDVKFDAGKSDLPVVARKKKKEE